MKTIGVLSLGATLLIGLSFAYAGGEVIELGGFKSKTPEGWKKQKPSSNLRLHQMAVPKVEGDKEDAELAIFYFGKGGGGGAGANIARWKGQFIPPEGKTIKEVSKLEEFKVGKADVTYLDISGTFKSSPLKPNAKEVRKENYRGIHVIFDTDDGPYFITLRGPAKTMAKNKEAFDSWLKAFK